jgi:hypothetical protein
MIYSAVQHLASQLNAHLKVTSGASEDMVIVNSPVDPDGSVATNNTNKLILFLARVEKDTLAHPLPGRTSSSASGKDLHTKPLYINLYVMLAAHFGGVNYAEALKSLSKAVSFFQRQSSFDHQTSPDLDSRIEKLVLDIENFNFQELNNVWGLFGGRYLPSVCYRVRMIAVRAGGVTGRVPMVADPRVDVGRGGD